MLCPARWLPYHHPDRFLFTEHFKTTSSRHWAVPRPPLSSLSFASLRITWGEERRGSGVIMTLLNNSGLLAIIAWMPQTCNRNHSELTVKTFTKRGFYDEHGHYVSWLWVITDIIPVKTKENVFSRRCNNVTRLQKMLSQAVTQHFHCRMWGGETLGQWSQ